jgi:hypothetical protein
LIFNHPFTSQNTSTFAPCASVPTTFPVLAALSLTFRVLDVTTAYFLGAATFAAILEVHPA